jgi:16S rRNA processing protein RimM
MAAPERVAVGRVSGAHGLRGQLRVACYADTPETLEELTQVWLGADAALEDLRAYRVDASARGRSGELRMCLAGIDCREQAELLRGSTVFAAVAELPPAGEGEFYGFELVGFRAESSEGRALGRVTGLWNTGSAPLVVIEDPEQREQLVPPGLILEIDREAQRLVVDAIPGLLVDSGDPAGEEAEAP